MFAKNCFKRFNSSSARQHRSRPNKWLDDVLLRGNKVDNAPVQFASALTTNWKSLDHVHCAIALRQMARNTALRAPMNLEKVLQASQSARFEPRSLSNCIHAIASGALLPQIPPVFVSKLTQELGNLGSFNSQDISNILWAFANRRQQESDDVLLGIYAHLQQDADGVLSKFKPQDLANTAWALARLDGKQHPALLEKLANQVLLTIDEFKPQEIANLLWAYATLGDVENGQRLCAHFTKQHSLLNKLSSFQPRELTNVIWAFATLNHSDAGIEFAKEIAWKRDADLRDFNDQALANLCWAFAHLLKPPGAAFLGTYADGPIELRVWNKLGEVAMQRQDRFGNKLSSPALAVILASFPAQRRFHRQFWPHMRRNLPAPAQCTDRDWVDILVALTRARIVPPPNFVHGDDTAPRRFAEFRAVDISRLLQALVLLGPGRAEYHGMLQSIALEFDFTRANLSAKALLATLWDFTCLDQLPLLQNSKFPASIPLPIIEQLHDHEQHREMAWQIFQIGLAVDQMDDAAVVQTLPRAVLDQVLSKPWRDWAQAQVLKDETQVPSNLQREVYQEACLAFPQEPVLHEARVLQGLCVDLFLPQRNLIIEVEGAHHFFEDGGVTGDTAFKHRLLRAAGYRVLALDVKTLRRRHQKNVGNRAAWLLEYV